MKQGGRTRRRGSLAVQVAMVALLVATVTAAPAGAQATGCAVDYAVANQWSGGFTANVVITSTGAAVDGWTLTWEFPDGQQIAQIWNADVNDAGPAASVSNAAWNAVIPGGGSVSFGFNGSWDGANGVPTAFALNGVACGDDGPGPEPDPDPDPDPEPDPEPEPDPDPEPGDGRQMEDLDRGLVSLRTGGANHVSWRMLGTDPADVGFNLYRGTTRVNGAPLTNATSYTDSNAPAGATYTVRPVVSGVEGAASEPSRTVGGNALDVPISAPPGDYDANDASVGDLDGDGQYEIVLKWEPANARDNSQSGVTDNVHLDAYELDGTRLWRIDLGRNIRAGAHYTQFMVYDLDGDGDAEVAMKTADGTVSGTGQVIGDAGADHRNGSGYVLTGPEFLTVFAGADGAILDTVDYVPARGNVSSWGDSYGNRVDRFLAGVAYLDGARPSLIFSRGYYTRSVIVAWDFRDGQLTRRWTFDSNQAGSVWAGQGNHQLSIADADGDGRDEVMFGAMAIDDDGDGLWTSGLGHGDAYHVADHDPDRPGLEVFDIQERVDDAGAHFDDARTGATLWRKATTGASEGPGRGVAADVWSGNHGAEMWVAGGGLGGTMWDRHGNSLGRAPSSVNFVIWWDGDPVRKLLDATHIDKYGTSGDQRLLTGSGVASNNGTKSTPALTADILGDWREEAIWRTSDNSALRIYLTTAPTGMRLPTLMHDAQYRVAVAWQNVAYNQPPHPSFYLGDGMTTPPMPEIYVR